MVNHADDNGFVTKFYRANPAANAVDTDGAQVFGFLKTRSGGFSAMLGDIITRGSKVDEPKKSHGGGSDKPPTIIEKILSTGENKPRGTRSSASAYTIPDGNYGFGIE